MRYVVNLEHFAPLAHPFTSTSPESMCGFAAEYSATLAATERLDDLVTGTRLLAHRGPDDEAYYLSPEFSAGFRRLKIIDLSDDARQPMSDESGRYWIVFNGEIYNYRELRGELEGRGRRFRTASDTEVLLAAYIEWGEACLSRLNGMFAFLIWDEQERRLFGARDRFGEKPLFYAQDGERWLFASEIKALFPLLGRVPDAHPAVMRHYLEDKWTDFSDQTFYQGVFSLPAAHSITIKDGKADIRRYWSLPDEEQMPESDPSERFRELFLDSVKLRLNADVSVGTCLSGGLDSGAIVCSIPHVLNGSARHYSGKTFTAAYPEYDESAAVAEVNRVSGSTGFTDVPVPESLDDLNDLLWYHDEPFHSFMAYASHQIMARARQEGVIVLLNGQGADETLAGYGKYLSSYLLDLMRYGSLWTAKRAADGGRGLRRQGGWKTLGDALQGMLREELGKTALVRRLRSGVPYRRSLKETGLLGGFVDACDQNPIVLPELTKSNGRLRRHLMQSIERVNLPLYLRVEDRNAMANSIESRLPFLDHRLVEFAFRTPVECLMRGGQNKALLRDSMCRILPDLVRNRQDKYGFPVPEVDWLYDRFRPAVEEVLGSREFGARGVFDPAVLQKRYRNEVGQWQRNRLAMWGRRSFWFRVLSLEFWHRNRSRYARSFSQGSDAISRTQSIVVVNRDQVALPASY